jgi:hypothetical protein
MQHARLSLLIAIALLFGLPAWAAEPTPVRVSLTGLPERVASGQSLTLRLILSGIPAAEAEVEVSVLLAGRSVGRTVWKVPVEQGRGEKEISLVLPEARARVPLQLAVMLVPQEATARADSVLLPEWTPGRLAGALRGKDIAVVDDGSLVAPALGPVAFQRVAPTDPLGVERFTGDLIVCHIPQFNPAWEGVVNALYHKLVQGRSVIWLVQEGEKMPPFLHSGLLVSASWPFTLRPGQDLKHTRPEDLLRWAAADDSLPLPLVASFGSAWLVICSDHVLAEMANEPAAGWLWEDILLWGVNGPAPSSEIKRLTFDDHGPYQYGLAPVPTPSSAVLSLRDPEWVQPSEQRLLWLREVRQFVERGNAVVVTGADADRAPALRALGLPPVDFVPVIEPVDLMLGPNLLLWRIARTEPSYGLLTKQGASPLLDAYLGTRAGAELFGEFRLGEGLLLLCQPDFEESRVGVEDDLLDHVAAQLLNSPGKSLLTGESLQ